MAYKVGDTYNDNRIVKVECSDKFGLSETYDCILHLDNNLCVYLKVKKGGG